MKDDKTKQWVVEYSPRQNQYHIDTLDATTQANLDMLLRGEEPEYIFIGGPFKSIHIATMYKDKIEVAFKLQENKTRSLKKYEKKK